MHERDPDMLVDVHDAAGRVRAVLPRRVPAIQSGARSPVPLHVLLCALRRGRMRWMLRRCLLRPCQTVQMTICRLVCKRIV
jgi:hypothetical protein